MRDILIDAIMDLAGDEYEVPADLIELAKESEYELVERLVAIACFYRDELQDVTK